MTKVNQHIFYNFIHVFVSILDVYINGVGVTVTDTQEYAGGTIVKTTENDAPVYRMIFASGVVFIAKPGSNILSLLVGMDATWSGKVTGKNVYTA